MLKKKINLDEVTTRFHTDLVAYKQGKKIKKMEKFFSKIEKRLNK